MQNLSDKIIDFSPAQVGLLEIALAIIMFSVALAIKKNDLLNVFSQPKALVIGLLSQFILLPLIAVLYVWVAQPTLYLGLGLLLVASCPGGNISNFFSYLAKANIELSVSLTLVVTLLSPFTTPLIFNFLSSLPLSGESNQATIHADYIPVFFTVFKIMVFPLLSGILLNHYFPTTVEKIKKPFKTISVLILLAFIVISFIPNWEVFIAVIQDVFWLVFVLNTIALIGGLLFSRLFLDVKSSQTISIETGIQNSGLGLVLAIGFFNNNPEMVIISAWWGIWHIITGFLVSIIYQKITFSHE